MFEIPAAVRQRVVRTRKEAEARLDYAHGCSVALRREIALLPVQEQQSPAIREILRALDGTDAAYYQAVEALSAMPRV